MITPDNALTSEDVKDIREAVGALLFNTRNLPTKHARLDRLDAKLLDLLTNQMGDTDQTLIVLAPTTLD